MCRFVRLATLAKLILIEPLPGLPPAWQYPIEQGAEGGAMVMRVQDDIIVQRGGHLHQLGVEPYPPGFGAAASSSFHAAQRGLGGRSAQPLTLYSRHRAAPETPA